MVIVFFVADPDTARTVASSHDVPGEWAAEPIAADGPGALLGLGAALLPDRKKGFVPLRDDTCRSYPVWTVSPPLRARLTALDDAGIDEVAFAWHPHDDTDPHERATCLTALRDALRDGAEGETLFALLEQRAL